MATNKKNKSMGFNISGSSSKYGFKTIPNESVSWRLQSADGKYFGDVSYGAYKAVESGTLDSYKAKNEAEKKILDEVKSYIGWKEPEESKSLVITDYRPGTNNMSKNEYLRRQKSNPDMPEFGSYEYFKNREEYLRPIIDEIADDADRYNDTYKAWAENYAKDNTWAEGKPVQKLAKKLYEKFKYQDAILAEYKDIDAQLKKFDKKGIHYDNALEIDTESGAAEAKYAKERLDAIVNATTFTNDEMVLGVYGELPKDKQKEYDNVRVVAGKRNVEAEKEKAYNYYDKNKDNVYKDDLWGRITGNYKIGRISIKTNDAGYTSYKASTDDVEAAEVYQALSSRIQKQNNATFQNNGAAEEITAIVAQYAPQGVDQALYKAGGSLVGAVIGAASGAGAAATARAGGSAAVAGYMYRQTAGAAFVRLLQESNLSVKDAKTLANSEALASSAVEFGLDYVTSGLWKGVGSATKNATSELGEKTMKALMSKGISEKGAKTIISVAKNAGKLTVDALGEGTEEWIQEGMSITADKYAAEGKTASAFKLFTKSFDLTQYSKEDFSRMNQSFLAGTIIGFGHGGLNAATSLGINKTVSAAAGAVDAKVLGEEINKSGETKIITDAVEMAKDNVSPEVVKAVETVETAIAEDNTPPAEAVGTVVKSVLTDNAVQAPAAGTEQVKNEMEETPASVSVGDTFKDTKTGNPITVVERDAENTTVEISTGEKTETREFTNNQADTLVTNEQFEQMESSEVISPEDAQQYNIVVSNLKRKAEELGLLDTNFFNTLQNVNLYNPSASDRAAISSEFRRVFAGNTDPLVTDWLNAISVEAQPVTSINEQNMPVSTENTTENASLTNTDVTKEDNLPEAFKLDENGKIRFNQVGINYDNQNYREGNFNVLAQGGIETKNIKGGIIGKYGVRKKDNGYFGVTLLSSGMDVAAFSTFDEALSFATYTNKEVKFNDISYVRNAEGQLTVEATLEFMQYGKQIKAIKSEKAYLQTAKESKTPKSVTKTAESVTETPDSESAVPYTDKEKQNWENSNTIIVYESDEQFESFVERVLNNKDTHKKIYFGKIPDATAQMVLDKTGVDVSGHNIALKGYEIRKILLNSHGDEEAEATRGQEPITTDDLKNIPSVITNPDDVNLSEKEYEGKPALLFEKTIDGKNYVVAYVSRKHHDIAIQTMYKKRSLATAENADALSSTPETTSSTASNNIVSQDNDIVNSSVRNNAENDTSKVYDVSSVLEYTKNMKPMQKGKVEKTLNDPYQTKEYGLLTCADFMERSIADGRQLEERRDLKAKVRNRRNDFDFVKDVEASYNRNKAKYNEIGVNDFALAKEARELRENKTGGKHIMSVDQELYYYLTGDESVLPESCFDKTYCVMLSDNQFYSVPKTAYDYGKWLVANGADVSFSLEDIKSSKEIEKGVSNDERRNNVTARSVGRSVSESADKSGGSLYEAARESEENGGQRTDTESSRRIYAENVRAVQGTEVRQQGAFRCEFINPEYYTDDMRAIAESNAKKSIKTYFFFGDGRAAFCPATRFRGAIRKNEVYIQCDHARYSPEQINKHELVHKNYKSEDVQKVREYINNNLTEEEKRYIINVMYSHYAQQCKGDVNKVFEEFACDVLSGINSCGGKFTDITQEYWSKHTDLIDSYSAADYSDSTDAGGVSLSSQRESVLYEGQPMYSIERVNGTDKLYVKADRRVIEGTTPKEWGASVEKYINDSIRRGKDVQLVAADGDILTITADTAGKAKFRNYVTRPDGTNTVMNDAEYRAKLNAESHIDELSETSKRGKKDVPDYKNHVFAKDGFNYRTAYFEDFDGQYYKVTLSVGKNGEINTVYNVGKIKEALFPLVAQRPGTESTGGHKASTDSITYKSQNVNSDDMSFSLDEDGEFDLFDLWEQKNKEFGTIKKGENPTRDIDVPKKITKEKLVSQFARTMLEAGVTPDIAVSEFEKRVLDGTMTHEVITNDSARQWAINQIKYHGFEEAMNTWGVYTRDGNVGKKGLALGMELYNQCITNGDVTNAMRIAAELVAEATHAGQTLQAARMLKLMTPDGQLYYLEKSIQKMNDEFKKKIGEKYEDIELNEDLMEKFLTEKDANKRDEIYDDICQDIADQIPATLLDKWDSWRYLAMLGNPRTHIKNIAGNVVFTPAIKLKNYIGAIIERLARVDESKRTKSMHKSKEAVEFAKKDFSKMQKVLQGENAKYAVTSDIEGKRTIFKTKWLEALRNKNFEWLEKEDMWFLKSRYVDALAQIITARKLDVDSIDEKTLDIARAYAVREAQRATFRDANALAEALTKLQKKASHSDKKAVRAANVLIEGVMPFKKTPLNIAKQGVQYSPVGILTGVYKTVAKAKNGDMYSTTDIIDDFAKGLTGTAIMLLGTLLASLGIVSGGDDENKKKKEFDKMVGEQSFSLNIGDSSYTIDWMTPACLPLFTGVELYELTKDDFKFADIVNALSSLTDPLLELSVFSGISGAIESAQYNDTNTLFAIGSDMTTSYLTQALPTIGGQLSRIVDKNKREYYHTDKNSNLPKGVQNFIGQVSSKIPFASYLFEPSIDVWGREETYGGIVERTLENVVSPGYYSEKKYTEVDKEIKRLYESTGNTEVLPVIQQKKYTESKVDYPMTAAQWTEAKRIRGQKSFELIEQLFSDKMQVKLQNKETGEYQEMFYSQMSDEEKIRAIINCYEDARDHTKEQTLDKVKSNRKK